MNIQNQHDSLRSQLLKMSKLSQRAVDYSIKGFQLGKAEFSRDIETTEQEMNNLQLGIVNRGRMVLPKGMPISGHSRFTCCALRICHALHSTYNAATGIALETIRGLESGWGVESSVIVDLGQFVNGLVRLSR